MKRIQLVQFIIFSLLISGSQVSANTYGYFQEGSLMSHAGMFSQEGTNYIKPYSMPEPLNGIKYFENSQDPQKAGITKKQAARILDDAIAAMQSSPDPEVVAEGQHLKSLAYDLHPTVYIRNGNLSNPGGKIPECVDSDASSVWKLYEDNPQFNQVELITIRIEQASELATVVNLASLQNFTSLKYLYVLCTFEICSSPGCEVSMISQMVQGTGISEPLILYKISIPE